MKDKKINFVLHEIIGFGGSKNSNEKLKPYQKEALFQLIQKCCKSKNCEYSVIGLVLDYKRHEVAIISYSQIVDKTTMKISCEDFYSKLNEIDKKILINVVAPIMMERENEVGLFVIDHHNNMWGFRLYSYYDEDIFDSIEEIPDEQF